MLECSDSFQFSNCSWSKCGEMAKWRNNSSLGQSFKVSGLAGLFREIQRVGFPLRGGKSVLPLVLVWEQDQANAQCFGSLSRKIQIHFFLQSLFRPCWCEEISTRSSFSLFISFHPCRRSFLGTWTFELSLPSCCSSCLNAQILGKGKLGRERVVVNNCLAPAC